VEGIRRRYGRGPQLRPDRNANWKQQIQHRWKGISQRGTAGAPSVVTVLVKHGKQALNHSISMLVGQNQQSLSYCNTCNLPRSCANASLNGVSATVDATTTEGRDDAGTRSIMRIQRRPSSQSKENRLGSHGKNREKRPEESEVQIPGPESVGEQVL
jgi:hypothetical protein